MEQEQEKEEEIKIELNITQDDIVEAIKTCVKVSPLIHATKTIINTTYSILKTMFIDDKKYVILEAPTGSGKTILGFMTYFCVEYLMRKKSGYDMDNYPVGYYLTSAKILQEQIDNDIVRFGFQSKMKILKGVANYDCIYETSRLKKPYGVDKNGNEITRISYADRPCKGMDAKQRRMSQYAECNDYCPYRLERTEASEKSLTVLNYAYFLNIMRSENNPFFGERYLTISDEAHLIPGIVTNIFNFEFTQFILNQTHKLMMELQINYSKYVELDNILNVLNKCFSVFTSPLTNVAPLKQYFINLDLIYSDLLFLKGLFEKNNSKHYSTLLVKNIERYEELLQNKEIFHDLLENRPSDIFFESEKIGEYNIPGSYEPQGVYKHIIKDLNESNMVKNFFLKKTNKTLLMSATLGNIEEYAQLMGIESHEYGGLRLPHTFDFSKSPIYICKSGWLNYANFNNNIDKVLLDTLKVCNHLHPNEKGVIHTSTFKIQQLLKAKVQDGTVTDSKRFLFYKNAMEKEEFVEKLKNSNFPYIIVGPSLYEGIDLKDDYGRLNILIKVPYGALDDYTKLKMKRYPFWYKRVTIEKIIQSIGRTNRHTDDYSYVYVMDSLFDNMMYETNNSIVDRLEYKTIY